MVARQHVAVWRRRSKRRAKDKEALDSYIKSYVTDRPDGIKYFTIESLYRKVNGNVDGLEARIGPNPTPIVVVPKDPPPAETPALKTDNPETKATPEVKPDAAPEIKAEPSPETFAPPKKDDVPEPKAAPEAKPEVTPEVSPEPTPDSSVPSKKDDVPEPKAAPEIKPEATPSPSPEAAPVTESTPKPQSEIKTGDAPAEKTALVKTDTETSQPPQEANKDKPKKDLFDPVIITIPKPESAKPADTAAKPADAEKQPESEAKKAADAGAERPRVVAEKETPKCSITFSQENVSLLNNGGGIGILVGIEGEGI